ncbi:MAG: glutamate formiminotransferase, partial [Candidatus Bathyarchaeota archaeon]
MKNVVECVPNFSTSDPKIVDSILKEIKKMKDAFLLDYTFDDYYNRLVVTFVSHKESALRAALKAAFKAIELIDMNKHKGQHPRIGAVDVVPFIPLEETEMQDCIELAKEFGRSLAEQCSIPVYLYGEAATSSKRSDLDWIRKGGYERLSE